MLSFYNPGDPILAKDLNEIITSILTQGKIQASAPLESVVSPSGITIRLQPQSFWSQITEVGTGSPVPYSWQKVNPDTKGGWTPDSSSVGHYSSNPVYEINGGTLTVNQIVQTWKGGINEYLCQIGGGSGGSTRQVRFTGPYQKDPPEGTSCSGSPSPNCWYPGVVQKLTCSGWADTDKSVWVVFWYAYALIPPLSMGDPYTVVPVDGTAAHLCTDETFKYNPNSAGERDVWSCDAYSSTILLACDGGVPKAVLGG